MGCVAVILLDTHAWLWWLTPEAGELAENVRERFATTDRLAVAAISCWEVALKARRGLIHLHLPLDRWLGHALQGAQIDCLPLTAEIAARAAALPEHHRDPADRFIIATALFHSAELATRDQLIRTYAADTALKLLPV